jgi:hypothetical protein
MLHYQDSVSKVASSRPSTHVMYASLLFSLANLVLKGTSKLIAVYYTEFLNLYLKMYFVKLCLHYIGGSALITNGPPKVCCIHSDRDSES